MSVIYLNAAVVELTTKGDLLGFDTGLVRVPVGSDDQVLVADSTESAGFKWATLAAAHSPVTLSGTGTYLTLVGQDIQVDPITESDISDLQSYLLASDIDTFAELDAIVADKSLVSLDDGGVFLSDISVPDEVYGVGWNGSVEVPTKNAVYDQIESHTGDVANPHSVKEEQIDGARLTNASVSGATSIDWDAYKVFEFTLTGATTISDTNLPSGTNTRVVEMIITGDFTLAFPAYYEAAPNNDTYDGLKRNHLILSCINGTTSSEDVIYSLQTLTT